MKALSIFSVGIIITAYTFASTGGSVGYVCPLCSTSFESFTQFSYTTFGQNLDLRPYGAAMIPTPVPKCPNCNLVFYNNFLTSEELTILREKLNEYNLFINEPDMPDYYYLARVGEIVEKDIKDIIGWFLSAVWENKNVNIKNVLINITIENINKLEKCDESYNTYQMIKLDLLRRLGQFEEAVELIERIKTNVQFFNGIIVTMINRQIELIKNKDQREHPIPRND